MATVTLYDGETGEPVAGSGAVRPDPVVSADDHAGVSFALDSSSGRALVQFVAEPGGRRLVAALELADGDGLPDVNRAIQERLAESELHMAPPGEAPPHLNVFHHLAAPNRAWPDAEIRAHLVATDDPVEVAAPSAAAAVAVVSFFRERAPWKVVAVHAPGVGLSTDDADVAVRVDRDADDVVYLGRDGGWAHDGDQPAGPPAGPETGPTAATDGTTVARAATASAGHGGGEPPDRAGTASTDNDGVGDQDRAHSDGSAILRIYDGAAGTLEYDSRRARDVPETVSEDAKRAHRDGLSLYVDPGAGVVRALVEAEGADVETKFVAEYEHPAADDPLVPSFARDLASRVDDLGVEFVVDVGGEAVDYDRLSDPDPLRPSALTDDDVEWLRRADRPLDFAAPGGRTAFELAAFLRLVVDDGSSLAVCSAGRTDALAGADVVVTPEPDCDAVEPLGGTATELADRRVHDRLSDARTSVAAVVEGVDEVTGTIEARQRIFAAALSGGVLAGRGFTATPVDDDPIGRRRRQARSLVLYGIVVAGIAAGVLTGQFDTLAALATDTYRVALGPVDGTPLAAVNLAYAVDGALIDGVLVVGGCLVALLAGLYWLVGYPLAPVAAARMLARTLWRQVTGGAGSGTVPSSIRPVADDLQSSFDDLGAVYDRLAEEPGTMAARADDFGAFLESRALAGPGVPSVAVVPRRSRWGTLLVGVVAGTLVGATTGVALLAAGWFAIHVGRTDPTVVLEALVALVALVLTASVVKGVVLVVGRWRPPRWSTTR